MYFSMLQTKHGIYNLTILYEKHGLQNRKGKF